MIGELIKLPDFDTSMSDDAIRDWVLNNKTVLNGGYATKICKKCRAYYIAIDGTTKTAKIVNQCKNCFED